MSKQLWKIRLLKLIFVELSILSLNGCSSHQQVNPTPQEVNVLSSKNEAQKELWIKKGFENGRESGFREGLEYAKSVFSEFEDDLRAREATTYLIKEKYVRAGPIYIDSNGKITLGKMEVIPPFTVGDIFIRYGSKIPKFNKTNAPVPNSTVSVVNEIESSVSPEILSTTSLNRKIDNKDIRTIYVEVFKTKTNQDFLERYGFEKGIVDDKYIVKFDSEDKANTFCKNFDMCIK